MQRLDNFRTPDIWLSERLFIKAKKYFSRKNLYTFFVDLLGFLGDYAPMETQQTLSLKPAEACSFKVHISAKCNYRKEGDIRVIFANGIPIFHYARNDKAAHQYAMIHLVETGLASQQEVTEAFNCSRLTIFKAKKKCDEGGMEGLIPKKTGPKDGSNVSKAKARRIVSLKEKGLTNTAIGSRLGLKEDTVRKAPKRIGWSQPKVATQVDLQLNKELTKIDSAKVRPSEQGVPEIKETGKTSNTENDSPLHEVKRDPLESEQVSYDPDPSNPPLPPFSKGRVWGDSGGLFPCHCEESPE